MDTIESEDLSSYTLEELKQLLEINKQTLDYYNKLLEDKTLTEDNRKAIHLCKGQIEVDMADITYELKKRDEE